MDIGEKIEHALRIETVFEFEAFGLRIPVTETVATSWAVMAVLIVAAWAATRRMEKVPRGAQVLVEAFVGGLEGLSREHFGDRWFAFAPYLGSVFLFLMASSLAPVLSPVAAFGFEPPFEIKPPTRDINVAAAYSVASILIVLAAGFRARGIGGWLKHLAHPLPLMIPFNLMEYLIRPLSLCLRLFGNMLGAFIIMRLLEAVAPLGIPPLLSLYFDFLDGLIQSLVFTFLTTLFIAEAVGKH